MAIYKDGWKSFEDHKHIFNGQKLSINLNRLTIKIGISTDLPYNDHWSPDLWQRLEFQLMNSDSGAVTASSKLIHEWSTTFLCRITTAQNFQEHKIATDPDNLTDPEFTTESWFHNWSWVHNWSSPVPAWLEKYRLFGHSGGSKITHAQNIYNQVGTV